MINIYLIKFFFDLFNFNMSRNIDLILNIIIFIRNNKSYVILNYLLNSTKKVEK